ncbi:hypothetical protein BKA64DRAFT_660589 [Cadophora sp. MPI-SDFR-AT-0126]|nr:hypothetical protein BKA64DRAFT_660589 [Leotiomycetes sp. MPI-SDFR-AT-0126]
MSTVMEAQAQPQQQGLIPRKRTITSCSNCYRRKQKCNRRRPCNNCVARKVAHECVYDASFGNAPPSTSIGRISPSTEEKSHVVASSNGDVRDQFGYSSVSNSNAFMEADRIFQIPETQKSPVSCWDPGNAITQKYWQLVSELPPSNIIDELVSIYISDVHWIYGIIEPQYFYADLQEFRRFTSKTSRSASMESMSATLKYFPAVLFQVLATVLQYLPRGCKLEQSLGTTSQRLSLRYSNAGVEIIQLLGNRDNCITAVVHDLIRAAWLKNCGRGAQAWHALSDSVRKAQDLNLHQQERPLADLLPQEFWHREWKRRVWANVFIWDSNMSIILGRPRLINSIDCNAEPPIDYDIPEDINSIHPSMAQSFASDRDRAYSSISMNLFIRALSQKINDIRDSGADKRGLRDYNVVQRLHSETISLSDTLPPVLRPDNPDRSWDLQMSVIPRQRAKIHTMIYSLLLALHRPHIGKSLQSRQRAQESALNVLDSQQRFFEVIDKNHYAYFGNAFFSIDASIVLSTIISVYPCEDLAVLRRSMLAVQLAMGMLGMIEKENELAASGIGIIRSCYQAIKDKYEERKMDSIPVSGDWGETATTSTSHTEAPVTTGSSRYFSELEADLTWENSISSLAGTAEAGHGQLGENEFDTPFWVGYQQQVFADSNFHFGDGVAQGDMFGSF